MITILVDHDIEGQGAMLWRAYNASGWAEIVPLTFVFFAQVGLPINSNDRNIWRFAQKNKMILITANRRMKEPDALERTLREENTESSLPVLTIGNKRRMIEKAYQERCLNRLLEVVVDLDDNKGTGRIFIP
jgi:hypothetical protein